jgi:ABC-type dipeptide/oligopeptide/nickel transport system permease subunit
MKAVFGAAVVVFLILVGLFAPLIAPGNPNAVVAKQNLPPSLHHLFGTTGQGNDDFAQVVWGTRNSVGFLTGAIIAVVWCSARSWTRSTGCVRNSGLLLVSGGLGAGDAG